MFLANKFLNYYAFYLDAGDFIYCGVSLILSQVCWDWACIF